MTHENRKRNVAIELERADEAFRSAEALLSLSLSSDSVSRAYYAAFHVLRALLISRGLEPKTHSGAIQLLNLELIRPGKLSTKCNRLIAGLQRSRELADYDAVVRFSAEEARAELQAARDFELEARALLTAEGWC